MFYNIDINMAKAEKISMRNSEQQLCLNMIKNELHELKIPAKIKAWDDEFGTYIQLECSDLNISEKDLLKELRKRHEKVITESPTIRLDELPKVDYIDLKFVFTSNYKQKVWSWLQKQFSELSNLPKNFYELECYHKAPVSKISALQILDEALNERIIVN